MIKKNISGVLKKYKFKTVKKPLLAWDSSDILPPPAPLKHKIDMASGLTIQFLGFFLGVAYLVKYGWMGWFYFSLLIAGVVLPLLGITVGYHRLLAHRAFEARQWVKNTLVVLGALSLQNSPISWVAVHRRHHALTDVPGDPHSPKVDDASFWGNIKAFYYAHMGWILTGYLLDCDHKRYVSDLMRDPFIAWVHRYYMTLWVPLTFILPGIVAVIFTQTIMGFFSGVLWGSLVPLFISQQVTFSINSICHLFGKVDYMTNDTSKNNWLFGLLGFGEGWHNNHHAFPYSARLGLHWWQLDAGWALISLLKVFGLVWNVRVPNMKLIGSKKNR